MGDTKGQKQKRRGEGCAEGQRKGDIKEQMEEIKRLTDGDREGKERN